MYSIAFSTYHLEFPGNSAPEQIPQAFSPLGHTSYFKQGKSYLHEHDPLGILSYPIL